MRKPGYKRAKWVTEVYTANGRVNLTSRPNLGVVFIGISKNDFKIFGFWNFPWILSLFLSY